MTPKQTTSQYSADFKKSLVMLHQNGKSIAVITREYNVSLSAFSKWIKLYSEIKTDNGELLTMQQVKLLHKKLARLEEENIILKKAIAHNQDFEASENASILLPKIRSACSKSCLVG